MVLESLPDRVKVYPTENYYYFKFNYAGVQYSGNIRLENERRDQGQVHFAFAPEFSEWKSEEPAVFKVLTKADGVTIEKINDLSYRVSNGAKTVVFDLNDLRHVKPPAGAMSADERFIGPIFDEFGVRFLMVYNQKLKAFHYLLDETVTPNESFTPAPSTDRILIGKRTGFAFYRDHKLDRKILIGVFEGNSRVNNYYDGPFDQLPDNFIEGNSLHDAILDVAPYLKGRIDRFGSSFDGETRYMVAPYTQYATEEDLHDVPSLRNQQGRAGRPVPPVLRLRGGRRAERRGGRAAAAGHAGAPESQCQEGEHQEIIRRHRSLVGAGADMRPISPPRTRRHGPVLVRGVRRRCGGRLA